MRPAPPMLPADSARKTQNKSWIERHRTAALSMVIIIIVIGAFFLYLAHGGTEYRPVVEAGADIGMEDSYGYSPLDFAVRFKNLEVISYLKSIGAQRNTLPKEMTLRVLIRNDLPYTIRLIAETYGHEKNFCYITRIVLRPQGSITNPQEIEPFPSPTEALIDAVAVGWTWEPNPTANYEMWCGFGLRDINFDGMLDIMVLRAWSSHGRSHMYWIFDPQSGRFVSNALTSAVHYGDAFDPETHVIYGGDNSLTASKIIGNKLVMVWEESFVYPKGKEGEFVRKERINGRIKVVRRIPAKQQIWFSVNTDRIKEKEQRYLDLPHRVKIISQVP